MIPQEMNSNYSTNNHFLYSQPIPHQQLPGTPYGANTLQSNPMNIQYNFQTNAFSPFSFSSNHQYNHQSNFSPFQATNIQQNVQMSFPPLLPLFSTALNIPSFTAPLGNQQSYQFNNPFFIPYPAPVSSFQTNPVSSQSQYPSSQNLINHLATSQMNRTPSDHEETKKCAGILLNISKKSNPSNASTKRKRDIKLIDKTETHAENLQIKNSANSSKNLLSITEEEGIKKIFNQCIGKGAGTQYTSVDFLHDLLTYWERNHEIDDWSQTKWKDISNGKSKSVTAFKERFRQYKKKIHNGKPIFNAIGKVVKNNKKVLDILVRVKLIKLQEVLSN